AFFRQYHDIDHRLASAFKQLDTVDGDECCLVAFALDNARCNFLDLFFDLGIAGCLVFRFLWHGIFFISENYFVSYTNASSMSPGAMSFLHSTRMPHSPSVTSRTFSWLAAARQRYQWSMQTRGG